MTWDLRVCLALISEIVATEIGEPVREEPWVVPAPNETPAIPERTPEKVPEKVPA